MLAIPKCLEFEYMSSSKGFIVFNFHLFVYVIFLK